jgi:hypothetical protein
MNQRFALLPEGSKPVIYKVATNQTARLKNEIPGRKVEIFDTLNDAKEAALALVEHAKANVRAGITMFSAQPNPEDEALLKTLSELTEDRVESYPF